MPNVGLTLILLYYMSSAQPVCSTTSELDSISDSSKSKRSYESASDADRVGSQAVDWPFSSGLGNTSLPLSTPHPYHADRIEKANWRPKVIVIGDNLAVNLTWRSRHSLLRPVKTYHVEYRRRPARSSRWSKPFSITYDPIDKPLVKTFCYITSKHLEAGMVYQFRVRTEFQNGDEERSAWSAKTSFSYISKVPPLLSVATRLPDGAIYVKWVLYKMRVGFPIDHFILLFRKVNRLPNGETGYSGFQYVIVPGHLDEYQVSGLDSNSNYMFVVYGVHEPPQVHPSEAIFTGGLNDRKITQFSQEVFVPAEATEPNVVGSSPPSPSSDDTPPTRPRLFDMNSTSSNSLMFLILGVLAGFMLTVMLALVAVCFCRQHREKLRLLAQMNSNTKDQPGNYNAPGGAEDHPLPKTGEGAGKADSRLLVSYQPHPRQQSGFLLSDLTPLAVANFRTATPTTTPLTDSPEPSLQSRRPPAHFFHPSNTNSPSRANGEVCGGSDGGGGGRGDDQQQPMSLVVSLHGTAAASAAMVRGGTGDTLPAVGGGAFPSENAKPPQRPNDLECTRSATSSRASNNSDSACSSFPPDPPAEAKREPPSGGSIHDESDDEENAGVALNLTPTKGLSTVFFTQMPFVLPAYPTTGTFEHPTFLNSGHSLSATASQTPFSSGGGRRFSPIAGRRSKLLSPLMEPYPGLGETRTDGQVITRHGYRRTAAAFAALRTSGEEQALSLLQRSVLFPRSLLGRQGQRNRRTHSFGSATTTVPLADVELSVSRHQSPTAASAAAALRIQAIVPNGPRCRSAGSRRSRSPTAYFPGLRITRCAGVAAAAPGSPKEADVAAPTPQSLPSARFQISPAPGLTPAMQSSCAVFPSPGQHSDTNASTLRPYQADAATQTGPLPVYPADASRYSPPPENVAMLDGLANNDRDPNNSRPISTTEASLSGLPDLSGSERFDSVSVCALSQTDFVDPPDQLHSSPSAIKVAESGCSTQGVCSPTRCASGTVARETPAQSQPPLS